MVIMSDAKSAGLKITILLLAIGFVIMMFKYSGIKNEPPVEKIINDTTYIIDTIHDTVFVDKWHKPDTVYIKNTKDSL